MKDEHDGRVTPSDQYLYWWKVSPVNEAKIPAKNLLIYLFHTNNCPKTIILQLSLAWQKLLSINYLEEKYYKSKNDVTRKLMQRRREDVRDQMRELSSSTKPALMMTPEESVEEEARQRRAAEREVLYLFQIGS